MYGFLDTLQVEWIKNNTWKTLQDMTYKCKDGIHIIVPKGTFTDFASIPRFAWSIIGHPAGRYVQASVLHDWLYTSHYFSRKLADKIFYEAMNTLKVKWWRRDVIFITVRWFGAKAYGK